MIRFCSSRGKAGSTDTGKGAPAERSGTGLGPTNNLRYEFPVSIELLEAASPL